MTDPTRLSLAGTRQPEATRQPRDPGDHTAHQITLISPLNFILGANPSSLGGQPRRAQAGTFRFPDTCQSRSPSPLAAHSPPRGSRAFRRPTPGHQATLSRRPTPARAPAGDPPRAAQDTDRTGPRKVHRLRSAPGLAGDSRVQHRPRMAPATRLKGWAGSGLPKSSGDALPAPTQPPRHPKGKWRRGRKGRGGIVRPMPLGAATKDGPLRDPQEPILGLVISLPTAPKGQSSPFKGELAAPSPRQVAMPKEGRWGLPPTRSRHFALSFEGASRTPARLGPRLRP